MLVEEMEEGSGPPGWDGWGVAVPPLSAPGCLLGNRAQAGAPAGRSPPKPILTSGMAGGAGPPQPHACSRAAAAPRLGTSPHHARPPTAPSPASRGKLRHDATEEQCSLSPPNPDTGPGPHAVPMSWVGGQQPWWHAGVSRMLFGQRRPGTWCKADATNSVAAPNPLVSSCRHWGSSASLLPAAVGMGSPSWTAGTGFCSLPGSAAGPHGSSPDGLAALPLQGLFQPRLATLREVPVPWPREKGAERCKRLHDGYRSPESVRRDQMCPLRSCEPGAMPAASGRAGGMPQHGTGWGVGPGAAPLGSGLAVTGATVASQEDRDEQRREGREEGERGAVGLHPPTFPLNKRQG